MATKTKTYSLSPQEFEDFGIKEGYFKKENGQLLINTSSDLNYETFITRVQNFIKDKKKKI